MDLSIPEISNIHYLEIIPNYILPIGGVMKCVNEELIVLTVLVFIFPIQFQQPLFIYNNLSLFQRRQRSKGGGELFICLRLPPQQVNPSFSYPKPKSFYMCVSTHDMCQILSMQKHLLLTFSPRKIYNH